MSGIEAVGIGLAILPLLISVAEHYNDCIQPILRYRRIVEEVRLFQRNLQVHKTIFRNQCRILLEGAIERDAAVRMLGVGPSDPSWGDQELEARLITQLGASKDACLTSIELIDEKLRSIAKESLDMQALVDETQPLKHRLAKKLRFSLSQSRLDEYIRSLRDLNDDFTKLSNQTTHVAARQARSPKAQVRPYEKEVLRYKAVGEASEKVYEALGRACTKHSEHLAHFCVNPVTESAGNTNATHFKFHVAITRYPGMAEYEHTPRAGDSLPLWFMIDTVMEKGPNKSLAVQSCGQTSGHRSFVDTLKREFESVTEQTSIPKKSQKTVRFQTPKTDEAATSSNLSSLLAVPRFRKDFCDILKAHLGSACSPDSCIGLLENDGSSKHRVYTPSKEVLYCSKRQTTLLNVLKSSKPQLGAMSGLLTHERLHLAKDLAIAVLQYHATPWMSISWRSRDIHLFDKDEKSNWQNVDFSSLHVNVKIKDRRSNPGAISSETSPQSLAPNNLLFSLGITLLELAYSSDLRTLQRPSDLEDGRDGRYTEFFIAKRLASNAIREMGGTYSNIVKKLLQCNFGCGDDLNDPKLQALFYNDVVCELDRLEQAFRKLELE